MEFWAPDVPHDLPAASSNGGFRFKLELFALAVVLTQSSIINEGEAAKVQGQADGNAAHCFIVVVTVDANENEDGSERMAVAVHWLAAMINNGLG